MRKQKTGKTGVKPEIRDRLIAYLTPLVFGLYPILFFYATNIDEAAIGLAFTPILIVLIVTPLLLLAFQRLTKEMFKASMIAIVFWGLFFTYGRFFSFTESHFETINNHLLVGSLWLLIFGSAVALIMKLKPPVSLVKTCLFAGVVLLLIQVVSVATFTRPTVDINSYQHLRNNTSKKLSGDIENLPNIYYIMLDSYPRQDVLSEYFEFDNSPFVSELIDLGFYDAYKSNANYNHTYLTMVTTLNMSYLVNTEILENATLLNLYQNNKILDYLGDEYTFVNNSSFFPAVFNPLADVNINCSKTNEFLVELASTTALLPLQTIADETRNQKREDALCTIENIDAKASEPKFVFTHLMPPHPPYLFGANGEDTQEVNLGLTGWTRWLAKEPYIEQLKYVNSRVLEKVNSIVSKDPNSIIIVQSDHGTLSSATEKTNLSDTRPIVLRERSRNVTFISLPETCDDSGLYESMTNVNTFRLIFNSCFGEDYEILEDIVYYATSNIKKDDSVDITDIVRN